jgi:hypothetical protein
MLTNDFKEVQLKATGQILDLMAINLEFRTFMLLPDNKQYLARLFNLILNQDDKYDDWVYDDWVKEMIGKGVGNAN